MLDPHEQSSPTSRGLAAGGGAELAGLGPLWQCGSIPDLSLLCARALLKMALSDVLLSGVNVWQLWHSFEIWRRAHRARVAPVACPMAMLSTQRSSLCSQQVGIIIVIVFLAQHLLPEFQLEQSRD